VRRRKDQVKGKQEEQEMGGWPNISLKTRNHAKHPSTSTVDINMDTS